MVPKTPAARRIGGNARKWGGKLKGKRTERRGKQKKIEIETVKRSFKQ